MKRKLSACERGYRRWISPPKRKPIATRALKPTATVPFQDVPRGKLKRLVALWCREANRQSKQLMMHSAACIRRCATQLERLLKS